MWNAQKGEKRALPKHYYCSIVKQTVKQKWPSQTFQNRGRDNFFTHNNIWKKDFWTEERNCILQCIWFLWQFQFFNTPSFYQSRTFEAFPSINTSVRESWRRTAYRRWLWLPQIWFGFQIPSLRLTVHSVILQVKKSVFDSAVIVRCDENHWWFQQNAKRHSHTTTKSVSVDVLPLLMSFPQCWTSKVHEVHKTT